MRSLPILLLGLLLLAGCTQAPGPTRNSTTTPAAPADPFHPAAAGPRPDLGAPTPAAPVLVAKPGFAEPNIAVAPDGTLYVGNPGQVWRSDDHGKTWSAAAKVDGGGDGDIAVDGAGTLYYLGLFGAKNRNIPFLASRDQGRTWSDPVDISNGTGADREWIDATPGGHVYTTWRGGDGTNSFLESRTSTDGGRTWMAKAKVGPDGDEGPVVHDPVSGRLYIASIDQAEMAGVTQPQVFVYSSADEGQTWQQHLLGKLPRTSPVEPNAYASDFPVLTVDGNGTVYLAYSADASGLPSGTAPPEEGAVYGIFLTASRDGGATWSPPRLVSAPGRDARFPWAAAGAPGRLALVWYENVHGVPGEQLPDQWNTMLWESVNADAASPGSVAIALTSAPNHVGALCTSGTGCLAADRSMLDYFEVAIGLDGQPVVAYASSTLGTGVGGVAVKSTEIYFGTATGTSLL